MMTQDRMEELRTESAAPHVTPQAPNSTVLSADEVEALRARAAELVKHLEQSHGSKELEIADGLSNVGLQAQRRAGSELDFLRTRVGEMLGEKGAAGQVTKDLVDLRVALGKINPAENGGGMALFRALPFSRGLVGRLERIAVRYETTSRQVLLVERRLAEGRRILRRDNVELRKLYEDVEAQQLPIERNACLGDMLMAELTQLLSRTEDPRKRERIQAVLFDVSTRVQDLRATQEIHTQFFVSIEMTRVNNSRLGQAVERTLSLTTSTLMVGLAIQSALSRQRRVLEATQRTREFLGDLIVSNAAVIKQHVAEVGDVYKNPVVAVEKLNQAHADLLEAVDLAGKLESEGIELARQNIIRLREMTATLSQRLSPPAEDSSGIEA
jgi:uncharacterized protein YaaN involved in tellurite resistance